MIAEERKANPITAAFNRRQLIDTIITQSRKIFLISEGEPVMIPLQEAVDGKLVACPPHEVLIATQSFYRDEMTHAFYARFPGYMGFPIQSYENLIMMNIGRLKYAEFLKDQGVVRVASKDEVTRDSINQSIQNVKRMLSQVGDKEKAQ